MALTPFENLSARLKAGDQTALRQLFELHYQAVCDTIYRYIKDPGTVEDLAQEVFIRLWEKREQIEVQSSFKGYLCRMAINEAIAHHRKFGKWKWEEESGLAQMPDTLLTAPEAQLEANELQNHITAAIDALPPRCRTVFQMSRYDELSYKEIAERMEISIKTVENQMGKALRVLREQLKAYIYMFF